MDQSEATPLSDLLEKTAFATCPMELRFIGGPNDGRTEQVPCWMLESRIAGHKYHLAISKSDDPSFPFKYVLVSHSLLKVP